jgi:hypothetical protein
MWSLGEIFSANSDKANLVTAVVSVIAAVLVVLCTHLLAARRTRGELKAKKLEECYAALADFKKAGWAQLHQRAMPNEREVEVSGAYDHAHAKLEMLSAIHVEEIQDKVLEMHTMVLTMQSFEGRDISPFQRELEKFIRLVTDAEQVIVAKVRKIV